MNDDILDEPSDLQDFEARAHERLRTARGAARDALTATADYIRANPWVTVAGAAVIGGVIAVLARPGRPEPRKFEVVRGWLDDACAKLPSQRQVQSAVDHCGVTKAVREIKRKLHL